MKILLLNSQNVIIDMVDEVKYVEKNKNGLTVLCKQHKAQGYIGSDGNTIYAKVGTQLIGSYSDIAKEVTIDDVDEDIKPLEYKYDFESSTIILNDEIYPADNISLTEQIQTVEANLDYMAMMLDVEI